MKGFIETYRGVVYPWHCDHQSHLNTMHYVGMFDMAFWHHLSALGFRRAYMQQQGTGFVDVKDTIEYKVEQPVGSLLVIESGLIRMGNTSITALHRMRNTETGDIVATSEKISVYFDLKQRRKTSLPDDLAKVMAQNIVEQEG